MNITNDELYKYINQTRISIIGSSELYNDEVITYLVNSGFTLLPISDLKSLEQTLSMITRNYIINDTLKNELNPNHYIIDIMDVDNIEPYLIERAMTVKLFIKKLREFTIDSDLKFIIKTRTYNEPTFFGSIFNGGNALSYYGDVVCVYGSKDNISVIKKPR